MVLLSIESRKLCLQNQWATPTAWMKLWWTTTMDAGLNFAYGCCPWDIMVELNRYIRDSMACKASVIYSVSFQKIFTDPCTRQNILGQEACCSIVILRQLALQASGHSSENLHLPSLQWHHLTLTWGRLLKWQVPAGQRPREEAGNFHLALLFSGSVHSSAVPQ